jgi:multiple sugar transport system substrate-binding protein
MTFGRPRAARAAAFSAVAAVAALVLATAAKVAGKVGVAPLPWPSVLGGHNLAVSTCSTRKRTARDFIRYLTGEKVQRKLFVDGGYAPVREALYTDKAVVARQPYASTLLEAIRGAVPRPATPYYNAASETIQAEVERLLVGRQDPHTTVENLENRLGVALRGG